MHNAVTNGLNVFVHLITYKQTLDDVKKEERFSITSKLVYVNTMEPL